MSERYSPYKVFQTRKARKPIIEKIRRERMNSSILQLQRLIASTIRENAAPMSRLDKADILDYTVQHIQSLLKHQTSGQSVAMDTQYTSGYMDCTRETLQYLNNINTPCDVRTTYLSNHLRSAHESKLKTVSDTKSTRNGIPYLSTPIRSDVKSMHANRSAYPFAECSPIQYVDREHSSPDMTSQRNSDLESRLYDTVGDHSGPSMSDSSSFSLGSSYSMSLSSGDVSLLLSPQNQRLSSISSQSPFKISQDSDESLRERNSYASPSQIDSLKYNISLVSPAETNHCRKPELVVDNIVSLGNSREDQIGHAVSDIWRPW